MAYLKHLIIGILFGIILVKTEVISWFRIQEMFRFDSFHMYGVIGSAAFLGMLSILLIKIFSGPAGSRGTWTSPTAPAPSSPQPA